MKIQQRYPPEFCAEAVKLVSEQGVSQETSLTESTNCGIYAANLPCHLQEALLAPQKKRGVCQIGTLTHSPLFL